MEKKIFKLACLGAFLLSFSGIAQSVGINTEAPTETFDVKGTTRIQTLPTNGQTNVISTKTDGTKSENVDQTFNATKTVVVDNNGVLGVVNGLPLSNDPNVKTLQYATSFTPIDGQTPTNSVVKLGNLEVRFNGTDPKGGEQSLSFRLVGIQDNVIVNTMKYGRDDGPWSRRFTQYPANDGTWNEITVNKPNVIYQDYVILDFALLNSKELYRVSCVVNPAIGPEAQAWNPSSTYSYESSIVSEARVTLFVEKLTGASN